MPPYVYDILLYLLLFISIAVVMSFIRAFPHRKDKSLFSKIFFVTVVFVTAVLIGGYLLIIFFMSLLWPWQS
jgi:hypothetical protein